MAPYSYSDQVLHSQVRAKVLLFGTCKIASTEYCSCAEKRNFLYAASSPWLCIQEELGPLRIPWQSLGCGINFPVEPRTVHLIFSLIAPLSNSCCFPSLPRRQLSVIIWDGCSWVVSRPTAPHMMAVNITSSKQV